MRITLAVVLLLGLMAAAPLAASTPPSDGSTPSEGGPRIVAIYPNPTLDGDRGEFVVLSLPAVAGNLSLTDGETTVEFRTNRTGRLAVATDPAARNLTDTPVLVVGGQLRLSNGGEWVALRSSARSSTT